MTPQEWLAQLTAALPGDQVALTSDERELLLDLARVAAHTSERWAAPLSTYLAGLALAGTDADDRVEVLRRIVADLDPDFDPDADG